MLSTKLVSLMLFLLLTLPVLLLLITILYYSINNVVEDAKNKNECEKDADKAKILCNQWDIMENKCYKGLIDSSNSCNRDILKNIPKDLYLVSAFIIFSNIFFAMIKINC
jgi:hypothetical protein